jgi:hypothetical protein
MEKSAALRQLNLQPVDFDHLANDRVVQGLIVDTTGIVNNPFADARVPLLDLVRKLVTDISSGSTQRYAPLLANVTPDQIEAFGNAVAQERQGVADAAQVHLNEIHAAYTQAFPGVRVSSPAATHWALANGKPAAHELYSLALAHGEKAASVTGADEATIAQAFPQASQDLAAFTKDLLNLRY